MHWGGEIVNDTGEPATLHAVLELKGANGARFKQFETSAVNVRAYGSQLVENFFLVPPDVWGRTESLAQWGERSEKKPLNGERIRKIELYAVSWCPSCRMAREWLAGHRVEYFDYDIESDEEAHARHEALGTGGRIPALWSTASSSRWDFRKRSTERPSSRRAGRGRGNPPPRGNSR